MEPIFLLIAKPNESVLSWFALSWHDISGVLGWLLFGSGLIELSPIKINPLSWVLKRLGGVLNSGVKADIQNLSAKVDSLEEKVDKLEKSDITLREDMAEAEAKREAINARRRILIFADDIRKGENRFSEERYNEILFDVKTYNDYCAANPLFKNAKTVISQKIINEKYEDCMKNNLFL